MENFVRKRPCLTFEFPPNRAIDEIPNPNPRLASFESRERIPCRCRSTRKGGISPSLEVGKMGNSYLARVDPLTGETIVVGPHCGGWLSKLSLSGLLPLSSRFRVDFRQILWCRLCG